jgi:hypothetical protein
MSQDLNADDFCVPALAKVRYVREVEALPPPQTGYQVRYGYLTFRNGLFVSDNPEVLKPVQVKSDHACLTGHVCGEFDGSLPS